MRFAFLAHDALPRLAWCAHVRRGGDVVEVHHGPWVETGADWFAEGAWPGPFEDGPPLDTLYLAGTAGRAEPARVVFCAPRNLCDRLQSVQIGDDLYVSNSMAFLLRMTDDEPDPRYRYYGADRLGLLQSGIRDPDKRVHTVRGRQLRVHDHCDVAIDRDLSLRRLEKIPVAPPRDYADYVSLLEQTIGAIQANAADPARRRRRYRPLATISRGYDSPALAVLMRRAGAREAITITGRAEDDGTMIGRRLGYDVTGRDRLAFRGHPGACDAEFHATPPGYDVVMAAFEEELTGSLLVTGRVTPRLHTTRRAPRDLFNPTIGQLAGSMMSEFRLRVGFIHLVPYLLQALNPEAIHAVTMSPEMRPWSLGGTYDKPILRRILEEAGIPRAWFGQHKHASSIHFVGAPEDMSAEAAADFRAYLGTLPAFPRHWRLTHRVLGLLGRHRGDGVRRRIDRALGARRWRRPFLSPHTLSTLEMSFAFHWGYARIRSRYDAAASRRRPPPTPC